MKKSLIVLLSALCVSGLNAQDYNLGGNKFGDNWSIGLNGGIATPLTHSTFFKNSRAVIGLDINKQLSPIYGLTLESNWTINTQSRMAAQKMRYGIRCLQPDVVEPLEPEQHVCRIQRSATLV